MHYNIWAVTKTDNEEELNKVMRPYHQYECDGIIDEYVNYEYEENGNIDDLKEYLEENTDKSAVDFLKECCGYENIYHESDNVSKEELKNNGVDRYAVVSDDERKYIESYVLTNPNAQWDCWTIGGRWDNGNNCIKKSDFDCDHWFEENENVPCYGLVDENEWYGDYCADEEEWVDDFRELWDNIPDDYYIWQIDCHM